MKEEIQYNVEAHYSTGWQVWNVTDSPQTAMTLYDEGLKLIKKASPYSFDNLRIVKLIKTYHIVLE